MFSAIRKWWLASRRWHREHEAAWEGWVEGTGSASKFEEACERAVLEAFGEDLSNRYEESGEDYHFVCFDFGGSGMELTIQDDGGVRVDCGKRSVVFLEKWDARTPAELIDRAVRECRSLLCDS